MRQQIYKHTSHTKRQVMFSLHYREVNRETASQLHQKAFTTHTHTQTHLHVTHVCLYSTRCMINEDLMRVFQHAGSSCFWGGVGGGQRQIKRKSFERFKERRRQKLLCRWRASVGVTGPKRFGKRNEIKERSCRFARRVFAEAFSERLRL